LATGNSPFQASDYNRDEHRLVLVLTVYGKARAQECYAPGRASNYRTMNKLSCPTWLKQTCRNDIAIRIIKKHT